MGRPRLDSFPPITSAETRVLILGSMPGTESLRRQQYYAHPRNAFWRIMQALFRIDAQQSYPQRIAQLLAQGIGLWDVLQHCERHGSLDARIEPASEVPNNIATLRNRHHQLTAIFFNGQKAAQSFRKHLLNKNPQAYDNIHLHTLPSTSPAMARLSEAGKVEQWRKMLSFI